MEALTSFMSRRSTPWLYVVFWKGCRPASERAHATRGGITTTPSNFFAASCLRIWSCRDLSCMILPYFAYRFGLPVECEVAKANSWISFSQWRHFASNVGLRSYCDRNVWLLGAAFCVETLTSDSLRLQYVLVDAGNRKCFQGNQLPILASKCVRGLHVATWRSASHLIYLITKMWHGVGSTNRCTRTGMQI